MLPLWLLAAHMVGDFILATRWQAATKFDDGAARTRHVLGYCAPFVPIFFAYAPPFDAVDGLIFLFALHWLTDCQRFRSTLGDVIGWRLGARHEKQIAEGETWHVQGFDFIVEVLTGELVVLRDAEGSYEQLDLPELIENGHRVKAAPLPPNPWEPIALFIDQGLHVLQLALVGTLFLT